MGAAADETASYGTEIWLDLQATVGDRGAQETKLSRSSVTVCHRHQRLICVAIHSKAFSVAVVAGHAPLDNQDNWWEMRNDVLSQPGLSSLDQVWLLAASARVLGDLVGGCIGPIGDGSINVLSNSTVCSNISRCVSPSCRSWRIMTCGCRSPLKKWCNSQTKSPRHVHQQQHNFPSQD